MIVFNANSYVLSTLAIFFNFNLSIICASLFGLHPLALVPAPFVNLVFFEAELVRDSLLFCLCPLAAAYTKVIVEMLQSHQLVSILPQPGLLLDRLID
jgi:hypothetical protein